MGVAEPTYRLALQRALPGLQAAEASFRELSGAERKAALSQPGPWMFRLGGFGGYRESGFGREGGREGVMEFVSTKTVLIG